MGIGREADVVFGRDTLGLDARVLPIACLFQGQLMHQKHRDVKGRDPAPLEASAKIRQLRRRGHRAALHRAGPPSTQLLTSRRREDRGGWQCMQGLCTLRQREAARTRKTRPPAGHCRSARPAAGLPAALLSQGHWEGLAAAGWAAAGGGAGAPLSHKASLSIRTMPPGLAGGGTAVRDSGPPCPEEGNSSL